MIRALITHLVSILVAMMLSYFLIIQVRGNKLSQYDILSMLVLAVLFYAVLIKLYPAFYVEYFEINPNIVESNSQDYQEDQMPSKPLKSSKTPTTCRTDVNIYLDGVSPNTPLTPLTTPLTPLTPSTPKTPITPINPSSSSCSKPVNLQGSISRTPSMLQRNFDDGSTCPMPKEDPAVINQLRNNVQGVLAQNSPSNLPMDQLKQMVTQKIDSLMPYISNQIRQDTVLHLDQIIEEEIDNMIKNGTLRNPNSANTSELTGPTAFTPSSSGPAPITGKQSYIREPYCNEQDGGVFFDSPRAAYRDNHYGWSYQKPQPPLTTIVESIYNGIKLGVDRLFSPTQQSLRSNDLQTPTQWDIQPWHF